MLSISFLFLICSNPLNAQNVNQKDQYTNINIEMSYLEVLVHGLDKKDYQSKRSLSEGLTENYILKKIIDHTKSPNKIVLYKNDDKNYLLLSNSRTSQISGMILGYKSLNPLDEDLISLSKLNDEKRKSFLDKFVKNFSEEYKAKKSDGFEILLSSSNLIKNDFNIRRYLKVDNGLLTLVVIGNFLNKEKINQIWTFEIAN